jgi:hypothetical protein
MSETAKNSFNFDDCSYAKSGSCFCPRCVKTDTAFNDGKPYIDVMGVCVPCVYCEEQGFPTPMYEGWCEEGVTKEECKPEED